MEKNNFVWKYESILDHDVTPEQFKAITGFDWEKRFEYLQNVVDSPYAGCLDIVVLYGGRYGRSYNKKLCDKYGALANKVPMVMDYCF